MTAACARRLQRLAARLTHALLGVACGLLAAMAVAQAQDLRPTRLAVLVKNEDPASALNANRARQSTQAVGTRLKALGYAFLTAPAGDMCAATDRQVADIEITQAEKALDCIGEIARNAEIVVLYYVGPLTTAGDVNYLMAPSAAGGTPKLPVDALLQDAANKLSFVGVVLVDGLEPAAASAREGQKVVRTVAPGLRRILAHSAPVGEVAEPGIGVVGAYANRLLRVLDAEIAAQRKGALLRDVRELLTAAELVASKTWPGRATEVLIERFAPGQITLAGRVRPVPPDQATGPAPSCELAYRRSLGAASCQQMMAFQKQCSRDMHAALLATAMRLRCPDEVLEQKHKVLQQAFAKAEQQKTCAAMTAFIEQFGQDYELSDAQEMEAAAGLKSRLCEQEARQKVAAQMDGELRAAITENDCAAFRKFERDSGRKLSPEQASRLESALKQRCELEDRTTASLRDCFDKAEVAGNFCGGAACVQAFKSALPAAKYFASHESDARRHEAICRNFNAMQTCFTADACGGERCSLELRKAVARGPLFGFIERREKSAKDQCESKRQLDQLASLQRQREAEQRQRDQQAEIDRRAAQQKAGQRERSTFRLTLCNNSSKGKIWVSLFYYDYDESAWVVEGWWSIDPGDCDYIGDRFTRGNIYFYAHSSGERYVWRGDFGMCVAWSKFRRVNTPGYTCNSDRHRQFSKATVQDSAYRRNFVD